MFVAPENPTCTAGFLVIGDFGDFGGSAPGDFRVLRMDPHPSEARCLTKHGARWMSRVGSLGSMVYVNGL